MDAWNRIRLVARRYHADALVASGGVREGHALNEAVICLNDLELRYFPPSVKVSDGVLGFLDRPALIVNVADGLPVGEKAVVIAHELGHFFLHKDPRNEVNQIDPGLGGDTVDSGAGVVHGYSPREQKEVQADVFAGEFLCPSDWLRAELLAGQRPSEIAKRLKLPAHLVMNQAIRALLLPELKEPPLVAADTEAAFALDPSQQEAVDWQGGPLLVDAGPGTGKTRTLVSRIQALLEDKVPPASILALTFSNKAAAEMRERVSLSSDDAAIEMWMGTFHAFGLELIQKWPEAAGRSMDVRILDQTKSLGMLEDNLSRLSLHHYQNLYEPAYDLAEILKVISRCKDDMILPEEYEAEASAYLNSAAPGEVEAAEKAMEVAGVYRAYEELLQENDAVDYGDLVMKAAQILESHAAIRGHYQDRFEHILVDEYQDVNLASARLLRALSADSTGVWVVADQRQSIYRFRGAAPDNVARFEAEFTGSRRTLRYNYRSGEPVVRTFDAFASSMQNVSVGGWTAHRGAVGDVTMTVATDVASEAAAIRDQIEHYRSAGIPYDDQVVLGRSHLTLGRICTELERLGVPLLYMGDLFERSEIRDLLSLVALDAEFGGIGLVYRAVSSEASSMDAVRVMTVHGSKGLEFGVVHLPAIATRYMPSSRKGTRCPPPPSLLHLTVQKEDHEAEEECLFFVALSRSRDYLSLSRAEHYTTQRASASKFLGRLQGHLPAHKTAKTVAAVPATEQVTPLEPLESYNYKALETYFICPARYSYENIDNLFGSISDNAYVGFHRCISRTIGWLEEQRQSGLPHDLAAATAHLDAQWENIGPHEHTNASYYRAIAGSAVKKMVELVAAEEVRYERASWDVDLNGKVVSIVPDRVFIDRDETVHVQRVRNSRPTKSEPAKPVYALLRLGAVQRFAGNRVIVETLYPVTGETVPADSKKDSKHLSAYGDAIASIERGYFPANPDPRGCPSCPCYFICGS